MVRSFIPNFFTLCNLLCGCIATILAVQNHLVFAAIFVGIGIFFDFFDGFFARMLGVSGEFGTQLDSLADMVTSGVVPGIVMVQLLAQALGESADVFVYDWEERPSFYFGLPLLSLIGLLIPLASAYRLAKFNLDDRQTTDFIGLPTPANTILILSLPLILTYQHFSRIVFYLFNPWFLVCLTIVCSVLLNVELRMFSLKFQGWGLKKNWFRYVFLIYAIAMVIYLQYIALPLVIFTYVFFSAIMHYATIERSP